MLFLILDEVVVLGGDICAGGALEAEGVFAVGDYPDDLSGEGSRANFVDYCLEVGA